MKKQALRTFAMAGLVLILTAVTVCAQSERSGVLNIPFDFIVQGKTLPAGEYTIEPNRRDYDKVWLVRSKDGRASVLFTTTRVQSRETQEGAKLIFNRYGDQYFLSQIWTAGANSGRELLTNRRERELARNAIERKTVVVADGRLNRN